MWYRSTDSSDSTVWTAFLRWSRPLALLPPPTRSTESRDPLLSDETRRGATRSASANERGSSAEGTKGGEPERARCTSETLWVYESLRGTGAACLRQPASKIRGSSNYPTTVSYLFHLRGCLQHAGHYFYRACNTHPHPPSHLSPESCWEFFTNPNAGDASLSRLFETRTISFRVNWARDVYLQESLIRPRYHSCRPCNYPPVRLSQIVFTSSKLDDEVVISHDRGCWKACATLLVWTACLLCYYGNRGRASRARDAPISLRYAFVQTSCDTFISNVSSLYIILLKNNRPEPLLLNLSHSHLGRCLSNSNNFDLKVSLFLSVTIRRPIWLQFRISVLRPTGKIISSVSFSIKISFWKHDTLHRYRKQILLAETKSRPRFPPRRNCLAWISLVIVPLLRSF